MSEPLTAKAFLAAGEFDEKGNFKRRLDSDIFKFLVLAERVANDCGFSHPNIELNYITALHRIRRHCERLVKERPK